MQNKTFSEELTALITTIQFMGEGGSFTEMSNDFLLWAFTQMVASDWYASLDKTKRQDLFKQYHELQYVLNNLDQFVSKYPDNYGTTVCGNYSERELKAS